MKPALQVVHESETQRQHIRVPLPATVEIDGKEYGLKDLSSGGLAVRDIEGAFNAGQRLKLQIKLPFNIFSFAIPCEGEVLYYKDNTLGCALVNLTAEHISVLSHALKSFLAGEIVDAGGIINVAARNNFTKPRATATTPPNFKRQIPGLLAVLALGLLLSGFVLTNVYNSLFVIKAVDAAVTATAPVAPADKKLPVLETREITAAIAPADAARLTPSAKAEITVFGSEETFTGHLQTLQSGLGTLGGNAVAKIAVDQELPADMTGRPATVTFTTR